MCGGQSEALSEGLRFRYHESRRMSKKKKIRVDLRKNRSSPPRQRGWTRGYDEHGFDNKDTVAHERVLRSLATDERSIVATGDRVGILPAADADGVIERVEPRHGVLTRASRGRE